MPQDVARGGFNLTDADVVIYHVKNNDLTEPKQGKGNGDDAKKGKKYLGTDADLFAFFFSGCFQNGSRLLSM